MTTAHGGPLRSAFAWVASGDVLGRVAVLVTTIVAARSVDPESFGLYVVMYAVALLAAALWDLGVSVVVSREVGASRVTPPAALRRGALLRILALPVWAVAFGGGAALVALRTTPSPSVLLAFAVASLGAGAAVLAAAALRGAQRFAAASASQASGKWATALLSLAVLVAVDDDRVVWLGASFAVGEVVGAVLAALPVVSRRVEDAAFRARDTTITLRDSLPFAANAVMSMVYNRFDVVLVGVLTSVEVAGLYGAASRSQDALYLIPAALGAVALPMLSRAVAMSGAQAAQPIIRYLWKMGLIVAVPVTAVVILAAAEIVPLLLGDAYRGSVAPLRVLVLFLPLAVIQAPILAGLAAIGEGRMTTLVIGVTLISAVILQLTLVPLFGAVGAAMASLGRDVVATPLALVLGRRYQLVGRDRRPSRAAVSQS